MRDPAVRGGDDPPHIRHFFPGLIDELRIYNNCLSEEAIKALSKTDPGPQQ